MSENWSDDLCKCGHRREFHSYLQGSRSYLGACDFDGRCVNGCKKFEDVPERDWKSENFCQGACGRPRDEHEYLDVSNMTRLYVCPTAERAAKWKKVEPGTVIPAGQPYRVEYPEMLPECLASDQHGILAVDYDGLNLPFKPFQRSNFVETSRWFIDSSWKPPLVLPTEPTWGIAHVKPYRDSDKTRLETGRCEVTGRYLRINGAAYSREPEFLLDFIPLTDEQVARIEAHND